MPLPKDARVRVKTTSGQKIRLAFLRGKVIETKNLGTGATHTEAEFKHDRARRGQKMRHAMRA